MRRRVIPVWGIMILGACGAVWYLHLFPPVRTIPIKSMYISEFRIYCSQWPVPRSSFWDYPADDLAHPTRSSLRLFEDGRELGPAHRLHEDIAKLGRGRFSHWYDTLYFSASDNSSPRHNRRQYAVRVRLAPRAWLVRASLVGPVLGLGWAGAAIFRARAARRRPRV